MCVCVCVCSVCVCVCMCADDTVHTHGTHYNVGCGAVCVLVVNK